MDWSTLVRLAWKQVLVRYLVVGVANTCCSYAVYALALASGLPYPVASLVSLIAGICLSFKTQGRLVFRDVRNSLFGRFLVSWIVIYLCHIGVIALLLHLGVNAFVAGGLALPSSVAVGFLLQRHFVFRNAARPQD